MANAVSSGAGAVRQFDHQHGVSVLIAAPKTAAPGARPQQTAGPFGEFVCHLPQLVTWEHGWKEGATGVGD